MSAPFVDTRALLRGLGVARELPPWAMRAIERATGVDGLSRVCRGVGITRERTDVEDQVAALFDALRIRCEVTRATATAVPRTGPLVFYANHPFGIADALLGLRMAIAHRGDTKVLTNNVLAALDINRDRLVFIDPFDGESRSAANRRGLRQTMRHLLDGGALLLFPAGACSHLQLRERRVTDPPWSPHIARLVRASGAAVVPLYFAGRNSWTFQAAGVVHPALRTLLLLREFLGLAGRTLHVTEGAVAHPSAGASAQALREALYALGEAPSRREHGGAS